MNSKCYTLEWKLESIKELEDTGLSYRLIALITGLDARSSQQLINGSWLSAIPLEYIRDPIYRFNFWKMADSVIEELKIAPKDREILANKLARVVEPLKEAEGLAAAEKDPKTTELGRAFLKEIELTRRFNADPTPENKARLREAQNYTSQVELKDNERRKKKYQEETEGV